jgi:hypothetical protein
VRSIHRAGRGLPAWPRGHLPSRVGEPVRLACLSWPVAAIPHAVTGLGGIPARLGCVRRRRPVYQPVNPDLPGTAPAVLPVCSWYM